MTERAVLDRENGLKQRTCSAPYTVIPFAPPTVTFLLVHCDTPVPPTVVGTLL